MKNILAIVPVTERDKDLLLAWRNEKISRLNSFNQKKINKKTHSSWFKKKIKEKKKIWIFKHNNRKCGMVKLEKKSRTIELSYLIAKEHRGKNLGSQMLSLFLKKYRKYVSKNCVIIAKSKLSNFKSNKSLLAAGFTKYQKRKKYLIFKHTL